MDNWVKPERLHKGDMIGFIAPCYALSREVAEQARGSLEELGYHVKYASNLFSDAWGYAGSDRERADDFHEMIEDEDVRMLLFNGGEVSADLLPLLDFRKIRVHPKIILSYSDSTTLLNPISANTGLVTFYGQDIHCFIDRDPYNSGIFNDRLVEPTGSYRPTAPWRVIHGGNAEGRLIGGYLANYALLPGSEYYALERNMKGYILFLEDHERYYEPSAVSRYLKSLEEDGILQCASGLIFGHYSEKPSPLIDEILSRIGDRYDIPVVRTEDFGHGRYHTILPIGMSAILHTEGENAQFCFDEGVV